MYYHIYINHISKGEITELDQTKKENLLLEILVPYIKNDPFRFNGQYIKREGIKEIKIVQTNDSTSSIMSSIKGSIIVNKNRAYRAVRKNIFYLDSAITDVTDDMYIHAERLTDFNGGTHLSYYHVCIKNRIGIEMYEYDIASLEDIIYDITIPYLEKTDFEFDGYNIHADIIERITIKETEIMSGDLVGIINDMSFVRESIFNLNNRYIRDITRDTIKEGKGKLKADAGIGDESPQNKIKESEPNQELDKTKVFIVHGHDNAAKSEVEAFIRRLSLEPIIIHQQANGGQTIIEKIERYSNVGFGVVLYTPCDMGASNADADAGQSIYRPRARQNVIFEHGYLVGKIGRENVTALVKDEIETPNDISGVVYIEMDSRQRWHLDLAKELRASGYNVDFSLL
ncbi:TIR domain-containing protein [Priestia megaterium]|uniref:TIR domain-containing protein n=1 Tax=Priestia megaterium TaxID=1404 RepID=UPI003EE342E7